MLYQQKHKFKIIYYNEILQNQHISLQLKLPIWVIYSIVEIDYEYVLLDDDMDEVHHILHDEIEIVDDLIQLVIDDEFVHDQMQIIEIYLIEIYQVGIHQMLQQWKICFSKIIVLIKI